MEMDVRGDRVELRGGDDEVDDPVAGARQVDAARAVQPRGLAHEIEGDRAQLPGGQARRAGDGRRGGAAADDGDVDVHGAVVTRVERDGGPAPVAEIGARRDRFAVL